MEEKVVSKLAECCVNCPYVKKCQNKRMEAVRVRDEKTMAKEEVANVMRESVTINLTGSRETIFKDELERLRKEMFIGLRGQKYDSR
jgi:hypothetical protein